MVPHDSKSDLPLTILNLKNFTNFLKYSQHQLDAGGLDNWITWVVHHSEMNIYLELTRPCVLQVLTIIDWIDLTEVKWVNTEWEQVAADRQKLQNIPNF